MKNLTKTINNNLKKITGIIILGILLWIIKDFPYINLVLTPFIIGLLIYVTAIFLFKFGSKTNIIIGLISIFLSLPWLLAGNRIGAENFGVFSYLAFFISFIQEGWKLRKEK